MNVDYRYVFAHTPAVPLPPYISVSVSEDGSLRFIVRSPAREGHYGDVGQIVLEPKTAKLFRDALAGL